MRRDSVSPGLTGSTVASAAATATERPSTMLVRMVNQSPISTAVIDFNGCFRSVNPAYGALNQTADAVERAREGRRASLRAKSYLEAGECSPVLGDGDGFDNGFGNDAAAYAHD